MKRYLGPIAIAAVLVACGSSPCSNDTALAKYAQDEMTKVFPVPASVSYTLDSVYMAAGNKIVRGQVTYTDALGQGKGPVKYWIGVSCADGDAVVKFLEVDWGGPQWKAQD